MFSLNLKPSHQAVKAYYDELQTLAHMDFYDEGAVSPAFAALLRHCGKQGKLTLVEQYSLKRSGQRPLLVDAALLDQFKLPHGYWEAKDTKDNLDKEIKKKFAAGYPKDNILFQAPQRAILYQHGNEVFNADLSQPDQLIEALKAFFAYRPPEFENWEKAVQEFKDKLPQLAQRLLEIIHQELAANPNFAQAFDDFAQLCRQALNPNLAAAAVEEMIVQHLLTERLFRRIFNNPEFRERNIIAKEIEKVITALTSRQFSRDDFLKSLDRFYLAIEAAAATLDDYSQKQTFLNTVYERFFQGFSVKMADTHGIVYTPQPIVNFMVRSVDEILKKEFGRSLGDPGVHILDPFVGTGNFLLRLMREIPKHQLEPKYARELHANEVMLLPYYIASMNIEHEYYDLTGHYKPFEGLCLVDTFELAEKGQRAFRFSEVNMERVEKQQKTPIFIIIGNPPYNAGQVNENDNNKNRKYEMMDSRVSQTYGKASRATLLTKLKDPYVKAIRWATDRINNEGIVALVTNNSFIDDISFDGMRKHLEDGFDIIYILDLGGNIKKNQKLSGTTHNVFGIKLGVSINLLIKKDISDSRKAKIFYARTDEWWRKEEKYKFLEEKQFIGNVNWRRIFPDGKNTWLTEGMCVEFNTFIPIGNKEAKRIKETEVQTIFKIYSPGVNTGRDVIVYDFNEKPLESRIKSFCKDYNSETIRYLHEENKREIDIDNYVSYDKIQWSDTLKHHIIRGTLAKYAINKIRLSIYRPFTKKYIYYDSLMIDRPGLFKDIFPNTVSESENIVISVPSVGGRSNFWCFCSNYVTNYALTSIDATQCFAFYYYNENGSNRRETLTDWALQQFRTHYADNALTKWDIFYYIYAILHHPAYREKYAANLKRELPRLPFAPDFQAFTQAGRGLADLHVNYESQPQYPLTFMETPGQPLNWRVEKMKLAKDKRSLIYNDYLTLTGIPEAVYDYKLGNRAALEWVIDQYKVHTDKRSGIDSDPNRAGDPQYIVRLLGQVITVSLETLKIIQGLPSLD